jgi:hypothetical protein
MEGFEVTAVEDRGHASRLAELAGYALSGAFALLCSERRFLGHVFLS